MFDRINSLKKIEKLEKALDKACRRLVKMCDDSGTCDDIHCPLEDNNCNEECGIADKWKEWCLKDE